MQEVATTRPGPPVPAPADGPVQQGVSELDRAGEPDIDRWTLAVRRGTGAAVAAVWVAGADGLRLKSISLRDGVWQAPPNLLAESLGTQGEGGSESLDAAGESRSYLKTPVIVEGDVAGLLSVADDADRQWAEADHMLLEYGAAAVATELRLGLARHDAARAHEMVIAHSKVHELIAAAAPLEDVLVELVTGIERQDPSVIPCVVLLDRDQGTLHPGAGPSLPPEWLQAIDGVIIGPNIGTCGSAAWTGRFTVTEDIAEDPKWAPIREHALALGLRHCWSMPVKGSEGEVIGTLALYGRQPRLPSDEHRTLMADGAHLAGIAIERHNVLQRLMHDARHDGLTGLPNRTRIFEVLEDAIVRAQSGALVAVMFIDLDSLKTLNDSLGHDHADNVIREIGARLAASVRGNDFVGRFGGDEFVVIAEQIADQEEAEALGSRLLDTVSEPLPGLESAAVTASIGVALLDRTDVDAREALREADAAMYEAKRSGRDRCAFFEGTQRVRAGRRLSIGRALRDAELRGELRVVFQPVFELTGGQIVGVEALLRWDSPTLGEVSPGEFIPIAEDTGAIAPIGAWVLRESCEAVAALNRELGRHLELGVNVSAHQLARPGFALSVRQTLAHAEFPANLLTLEITESALMRPDSATLGTVRELDALGIQLVLDDFGTGFSSLSWLKRHPLDSIKIDRSFVTDLAQDPRDQAIVSAVITMARALGCTVTAEGVETQQQLDILKTLSCDRAQGFLMAYPLPLEQLRADHLL